MRKKTSFAPGFFCSALLITLFLACSLVQTGCGNAGGQTAQQKSTDDWINMTITFKPNTDEKVRENAIKEIENMWIEQAAPFREKDPSLYPSIRVTTCPSLDPLKYRVSLLSTHFSISPTGEPRPLPSTTKTIIPCPPCPGLCIQCDSTRGRLMASYGMLKMEFEKIIK